MKSPGVRIAYYIFFATKDEELRGQYQESRPYENLNDAQYGAKLKRMRYPWVQVVKKKERMEDGEWYELESEVLTK